MRLFCLAILCAAAVSWAADSREVSFDASDGARIHANLYGEGKRAVVLAHGAVFNKESWEQQAKRLSSEGLQVLAIDFRGYGASGGGSSDNRALDVLAAARYLREHGAESVSVVGASMGGYAAAEASLLSKPGEIDRLVLLAAPSGVDSKKLKGDKLFIVAGGDPLADAVRRSYEQARQPKQLEVLPGSAHAQHIFKTPEGAALEQLLVDFLVAGQP